MSFGSPISPFDPDGQDWWTKGCSGLTKQICGVSHFLRHFKHCLRFGHLSRAPLHPLRLQIKDNSAECDWLARTQDPWDYDLNREIGRRHASLQALKDAIEIRSLLFHALPGLATARLRAYRDTAHSRELIIVGSVRRHEGGFRSVHSLAMRAKLVGFRFYMENGLLCRLTRDEQFASGD